MDLRSHGDRFSSRSLALHHTHKARRPGNEAISVLVYSVCMSIITNSITQLNIYTCNCDKCYGKCCGIYTEVSDYSELAAMPKTVTYGIPYGIPSVITNYLIISPLNSTIELLQVKGN